MALSFSSGLFNKGEGIINTGKQQVLSIPPSAFFPASGNPNFISTIGSITLSTDLEYDLFVWINLPNKASITSVTVWGNFEASNNDYNIFKIDHAGNATDLKFAPGTAMSIGGTINDIDEIVDNLNYSYCIRVNQSWDIADPAWKLYGATVIYQI